MARYKPTRYTNVFWRGDILYFAYRDEARVRREVRYGTGTPKLAWVAQQDAQARADGIRNGTIDPQEERLAENARRPIGEFIDEYIEHIDAERKGLRPNEDHKNQVRYQLERWVEECGIQRLLDADPAVFAQFLANMTTGARSKNFYRSSVLGLCRWAADFGKVPRNPIPSGLIPKLDEKIDRREVSRAMLPSEIQALLAAVPCPRRAYYLIAVLVGLRWSEIHRLSWGDVDLDEAVLRMPASKAKTYRSATLPLPPAVVEALQGIRPLRVDIGSTAIFSGKVTPVTWRKDLVRAGLVTLRRERTASGKLLPQFKRYAPANLEGYENAEGEQFDRKCLRTTFATSMDLIENDRDLVRDQMRHANWDMTEGYLRTPLDRRRALSTKLAAAMLDNGAQDTAGAG